jgi:hypothetical protein
MEKGGSTGKREVQTQVGPDVECLWCPLTVGCYSCWWGLFNVLCHYFNCIQYWIIFLLRWGGVHMLAEFRRLQLQCNTICLTAYSQWTPQALDVWTHLCLDLPFPGWPPFFHPINWSPCTRDIHLLKREKEINLICFKMKFDSHNSFEGK